MISETNRGIDRKVTVLAFISLAAVAVSRVASVLYSFAVTDVEYMSTALPTVLSYLAKVLSSSASAVIYALIVFAAYFCNKKSRTASLFAFVIIAVADRMSAFLIDIVGGDISGSEMKILLFDAASAASACVLFLAAWIIAGRNARAYNSRSEGSKSPSPYSALLSCLTVVLLICLVFEFVNIISFFIECDWYVYPEETVSMILEVLELILFRFVLPLAVGSVTLYAVVKRKDIKQ